jgi:mannose-1-phosphate guanylyltransferase
VAAVRRQLPRLARAQVLAEPVGRNTAPAIALAALRIAKQAPQACMIVVPSDHVIGAGPRFARTMARAVEVAERSGALVTLGIRPTRPETGYGYIRPGARLSGESGGTAWVDAFIEKPSLPRARRLVAGRAFWNSGMFVWRVDRILDELQRHLPDVLEPLARAVRRGGAGQLARAYRRIPAVSIDTGVMEHATRVAVVPATFPWSDVGSWAAAGELWRRRAPAGNASRGRVIAVDSRGCVVDSPERLVALLGVEDLVVVDTPDAVLVCRVDRAQDVRRVVGELQRQGLGRYL